MGVLDHHDRGIDHGSDRDRDPAEGHDVGVDPKRVHRRERQQNRQRQRQNHDERRPDVEQEDENYEGDDEHLLEQLLLQVRDRALNQAAAIVGRDDLHTLGEGAAHLFQLQLDAFNGGECILAVPNDDDPADGLALTVEFREATTQIGAAADASDVAEQHGSACAVRADADVAKVVEPLDVPAPSHDVLRAGHFDDPAPDVVVAVADRLDHSRHRHAIGEQDVGVERHLILLDEAADAGNLGDSLDALEPVAHVPVVESSQFAEMTLAGRVDEGVFEGPADSGRVGTEAQGSPLGKGSLHAIHVFEHARAGPVHVGAVLEDDVDEGEPEEGVAAHDLDPGSRNQCRHHGIGDLVLDQVGAAADPLREDDDLDV